MFTQEELFEQKKVYSQAERIEFPAAFYSAFPQYPADRAERLFQRYLDAVRQQVLPLVPYAKEGCVYVSTESLMNQCGSFQYKGERHWVWNIFSQLLPFVIVKERGSNLKTTQEAYQKNSLVQLVNQRFLSMLIHELSPEEVFDHYFKPEDLDSPDVTSVTINVGNLENYIGNTEYELAKVQMAEGSQAHRDKLQRNLSQATVIHKIALHTLNLSGKAFLPLIPEVHPYGRTYYKGLSIQNVSKEVRSAIIGHHYQYDMNAAVFAIKMVLYGHLKGGENNLVGTPDGSYTRQYLAEKKHIRKSLAERVFGGTNLSPDRKLRAIKDALTAIGFGAKASGNVWNTPDGFRGAALTDIIKDPSARATFLSDHWVKAFTAEQKSMEAFILANAGDIVDVEEMEAALKSANGNGRVNDSQRMAYLYQQYETIFMRAALEVLASAGIKAVAVIHDAFIVREKLSPRVLDDIAVAWGLRDYLSMDCDEVREWADPEFKRALEANNMMIEEHRRHIELEERRARIKAAA